MTEYPAGLSQPGSIVRGPDNNLWFISPESALGSADGSVGRLVPASGAVSAFASGNLLHDITAGPDGTLWLAQQDGTGLSALGRITTAGTFLPPLIGLPAAKVATGPDGNIWFSSWAEDLYLVGSIMPVEGLITNFMVVTNAPRSLTTGPDGNIWITESNGGAAPAHIARITPAGVLTEFAVATTGDLNTITSGPDGNLWFTDAGRNEIGRITPTGATITKFPVPTAASGLYGITAGPDGNLWFTERAANRIGKITPAGQVTELACIPTSESGPTSITVGADGKLWFTETTAGNIASLRLP